MNIPLVVSESLLVTLQHHGFLSENARDCLHTKHMQAATALPVHSTLLVRRLYPTKFISAEHKGMLLCMW